MEWEPTWFGRWPHTWDGGRHDWAVSEAAARRRLTEGEGLVTAWSSAGVPHTVLDVSAHGHLALQHAAPPGRDPVHRLTADASRRSLAVLPARSGAPFGSHDPYVVYESWERHGAVASRHPGDIRDRLVSSTPLPGPTEGQLARLRAWDPLQVVIELVAALPTWTAEAEVLPWVRYVEDARERGDAVVARLGAVERVAELLAPPTRRGLLGRRPKVDRFPMPLEVGAHDLEVLLARTGRTFTVHRSDGSRVLTAPVADGEVQLAVTVKTHPGLRLAVTGFVVTHLEANAAWAAPRRHEGDHGELAEPHAASLPELLDVALAVFDGFVEEFQRPVERALVPVEVAPPAY